MGKLNISIFKFHLNVEFFCELGLYSTLWSGFAIRSDLQLFKLSLSKFDLTTKDRMHSIFQKQTAVSWVEQIQRSTFVWYMSQINKCMYEYSHKIQIFTILLHPLQLKQTQFLREDLNYCWLSGWSCPLLGIYCSFRVFYS